ncbi:MAG: glycosyltransferase family 39 protein [Candidatus Daviesbacteria bacterium]|nr:glycosyltransferase family 39 protein [Candidatus Daviesbacteria bacterium]
MRTIKIILFFSVLAISIFLRFYHLDQLPPGLNADEASLGYDAYSLLLTGKDQYGKAFPIFLRSFGAYQSPLYAYLTTAPIFLFGLSIFAVRLLSALAGILTVLMTFIIIYNSKENNKFWQALLASFIVSFMPWSIFFSRTAVEANLALFLVAGAAYFLIRSLRQPVFFIYASILLAVSTYAYQAQRLSSILFLLGFTIVFAKQFLSRKKIVLVGLALMFIIQIPQLTLINSQAGTRRLDQVNYFSKNYFDQNGGNLKSVLFGQQIYIFNQFSSHYLAYFSPKNLFFDPDPQEGRSIPDLSVFYGWMFIPLLFGFKVFWEKRKDPTIKILLLFIAVSVIPAALTREPFYTLRVLPLFWVLSIIISFGGFEILCNLRFNILKVILLFIISTFTFVTLYNNYFILLKYERSSEYGFPYIELAKKTEELSSKKFVVDLERQSQSYIWFAFFKKYDPYKLQDQGKDVLKNYYNAADFNGNKVIGNVEIKDDIWKQEENSCISDIIVGDLLAVSEADIKEHELHREFEIPDLSGKVKLKAYSTRAKGKCY